ncbi:MAG: helix-turn-helix domain-containing protein, partial [Bacillota bacterium]
MKTGYIYKIERKKTKQIYIGQTTCFQRRMKEHKRGTVQYIDRAIKKHGEDGFIYNIIEEVPINQLNEREKYYIKKYNSYSNPFHYNNHPGGDALGEVTEEHKEKLSTKLKEFFSTSPEKHPALEISKKEVSTMICDYMKKDLNSIEIANKHNICARTIRKVLNGNHLLNQTNLKYLKLRALAKTIIYYYEELDLSYKEISQKVDRGRNFIGKIVTRKHQITKGLGPPMEKSQYRISEEDYLTIFKDYYDGKYTQEELANKYNVTSSTISKIINGKHSITKNLEIPTNINKKHNNSPLSKKEYLEIYNKYKSGEYTQQELMTEYKIGQKTVYNIIKGKHWSTQHLKAIKTTGENHCDTKITKSEGIKIYEEYKTGNYTQTELGEKYNTSQKVVSRIVNGKHWSTKHLKSPVKDKKCQISKELCLEIYNKYKNNNYSQQKLADEY